MTQLYYKVLTSHHQQRIYYVVSDELHGRIFGPCNGHFQSIEVHKSKIEITSSFL